MTLRDLHRLLSDVATGGSRSWLQAALLLSPLWLVLSQLGGELPSWLVVPGQVMVLATLVLVLLQGVLGIVYEAGLVPYARRHPVHLLFMLAATGGIVLGLTGRLPLHPVAGILLALDLVGRGFVVLTSRRRGTPTPALVLTVSFLGLIAGGTFVLHTGQVTAGPEPLSFSEALFTATSAVCVTGLTVIDVGDRLSPLGQVVLLVLIQLGGLGLMTLGAFVLVLLDKASAARGARLIGGLLGESRAAHTVGLAGRIVILTLVLEFAGAVLLWTFFQDPWKGTFCAVSAFCNAGFFLESTSLEGWRGHAGINSVVMVLIILGGLGFPVLLELLRRGWQVLRREAVRTRFSLATRLVLAVSAFLVLGGAAVYYLLERQGSLAGMSTGEGLLASLFQSVTMRTAGFDTVSFDPGSGQAVRPATLVMTTGFMSIGASPLSTGGGFKTVTLAILLLGVMAVVRGRREIVAFGRQVEAGTLVKAAAVFVLYTTTLYAVTLGVLLAEGGRQPFLELLFECSSALGTVGLSTGVTPELGEASRYLLVSAMFLGRVGPLTLFLLFSTTRPHTLTYPEEGLVVG